MGLFDDFSNCIGDFGRILKGEQPLYLKNHKAKNKITGTMRSSIGDVDSDDSGKKKKRARRTRTGRTT